jgi:hypothetical protein
VTGSSYDGTGEHPDRAFGDRIEAIIELAAEDPDFADWHHNYEWTLVVAEIDGTSLSVPGRLALRHIAGCDPSFVTGVHDLITAAKQAAYDEGYRDGLDDAVAEDEEDDLPP